MIHKVQCEVWGLVMSCMKERERDREREREICSLCVGLPAWARWGPGGEGSVQIQASLQFVTSQPRPAAPARASQYWVSHSQVIYVDPVLAVIEMNYDDISYNSYSIRGYKISYDISSCYNVVTGCKIFASSVCWLLPRHQSLLSRTDRPSFAMQWETCELG